MLTFHYLVYNRLECKQVLIDFKEEIMSLTDYAKAYKLGKKNYQSRMLHGQLPTLEVLDDIIPTKGTFSEVPLDRKSVV